MEKLKIAVTGAAGRMGRELIRANNRDHAVELPLFLDAVFVHPPVRVDGTAVFLCAVAGITPNALLHSLKHYKVLHKRNLFINVRNHEVPWVAPEQRLEIQKGFQTLLDREKAGG